MKLLTRLSIALIVFVSISAIVHTTSAELKKVRIIERKEPVQAVQVQVIPPDDPAYDDDVSPGTVSMKTTIIQEDELWLNQEFKQYFKIFGGVDQYNWSIIGNLPAGLMAWPVEDKIAIFGKPTSISASGNMVTLRAVSKSDATKEYEYRIQFKKAEAAFVSIPGMTSYIKKLFGKKEPALAKPEEEGMATGTVQTEDVAIDKMPELLSGDAASAVAALHSAAGASLVKVDIIPILKAPLEKPFKKKFEAIGEGDDFDWVLMGDLPEGLIFETAGNYALIKGTPTESTIGKEVILRAKDSEDQSKTKYITLSVRTFYPRVVLPVAADPILKSISDYSVSKSGNKFTFSGKLAQGHTWASLPAHSGSKVWIRYRLSCSALADDVEDLVQMVIAYCESLYGDGLEMVYCTDAFSNAIDWDQYQCSGTYYETINGTCSPKDGDTSSDEFTCRLQRSHVAPPVIYMTGDIPLNAFNNLLQNPGSYSMKVSFRCEGDESPFLNVSSM